MKKHLLVFFMVSLFAASSVVHGQEEKVFPFEYRQVLLENGFKAYLVKAGAPGQIACVTVVRAGSREEYEPGKTGYAHFFEHMMFRGTAKYSNYNEVAVGLGALYNAATSNDYTRYFIVASNDSLESIIDLESDRFMNLQYTEEQFRAEAGAILNEYSQMKGSPLFLLEEKAFGTAFEKHTYKHLAVGFEHDVGAMPEGYGVSLDFYRNYYRPENCVLLLAGDFDFDQAESLIRKYYAPWKPGYRAPDIETEPIQTSPRSVTVGFKGRTVPILSVRFKGPAWNATDRVAVATKALGEVAFGANSAIYRKLVIQDGKVQSFSADFSLMRDPGLIGVTAIVPDPSDLPEVEAEIGRTMETFRSNLCDSGVLEDAKSALRYGFLMSLETAQEVCFGLAPIAAFTGGIGAIEDYYRTLDSVTPQDIKDAARRYMNETGKNVLTVLPIREVVQ